MRNFLFSCFFVFIISGAFGGQTTVCSSQPTIDGFTCSLGCKYIGNVGGMCQVCGVGTYKDEWGVGPCTNCTGPVNGTFLGSDGSEEEPTLYTGFTADECPWTITCKAGSYWNGMIYFQTNEILGCTNCGIYYNATTTEDFTVTGRGNSYESDISIYSLANVCQPKIYTLNLDKNTSLENLVVDKTLSAQPGEEASITYENKTIYAKYGVGFSDNNQGAWNSRLPSSAYQPSISIKQFLGYSNKKDYNECENSLVFNSDSSLNKNWNEIGFTSDENTPVELYACWANKNLEVHYLDNNGNEVSAMSQQCSINERNGTFECKAKKFTGSVEGLVFDHYECCLEFDAESKVCRSPCNSKKSLKPDDAVPIPLTNPSIYLKAVFAKCPAGKYCNNGEQKNCPAGTTSAEEAEKAEDCYMPAGTSGTEFCDKNGCFNLPGNEKISYFPSLS